MSGSTEAHIREDSQQFLQAVENCDSDALRRTVFVIRGRCNRLGQVVKADVGDNPDRYGRDQLHQIEAAMKQLRERCKSSGSVSLLSSSFPFLSLFSPSFLYSPPPSNPPPFILHTLQANHRFSPARYHTHTSHSALVVL